ncbi:MAG TPA: ATP-binding cassette domain-containing protein [Acidimicrobiia bacterium]|nr:ATP-binding cassette domain-containing protein [Acidimicrobiia bacterium]
MNHLVELHDVDVAVDLVPIISAVSLHVDPGECVGIQGPNGAGKTTLLRVIATLLAPTGGSGSVLGVELGSKEVPSVRPQIGLAGHVPALAGPLTLMENLLVVARLTGRTREEAAAALARVGLAGAAGRAADRCSHGMRRRTDLARLFLFPPRLLLLDEPQAGLDSSAQPLVDDLIRQVRAGGGGAVLVAHDPSGLSGLADRMLTLRSGALEGAT